jgi:hypothetical protein
VLEPGLIVRRTVLGAKRYERSHSAQTGGQRARRPNPLHDVVAVERVVAAARRSSVLERSTRWLRLLLIALAVILRSALAGIGTSVF